jgi:hypothetical protein
MTAYKVILGRKVYKKHFDHKGQMINYWNKLRNNDKIVWATCELNAKEGYVLEYSYERLK